MAALVVLVAFAYGVAPLFYWGKAIRATVVDADTGQPIEGAIVVVVWQLSPMSGQGSRLHVAEAVTDASGAFFMPGWGPRPHWPLTEAKSNFPYLVIFKHGYVPVRLINAPKRHFAYIRSRADQPAASISDARGYDGTPSDPVQESVWNGMAIRIEPFRGGPDEWFHRLEHIEIHAGWRDLARMGRFYEALLAEREYFKDALHSFPVSSESEGRRPARRARGKASDTASRR